MSSCLNSRQQLDGVEQVTVEIAVDLVERALANDNEMIRLAGFDKRGVQSGDERLHGDVDRHRETNAHGGHQRSDAAHPQAANVVFERNFHGMRRVPSGNELSIRE